METNGRPSMGPALDADRDGASSSSGRAESHTQALTGVWRDFRVLPGRKGRGKEVIPLRVN
jgi:hypothetical protein